MNCGSVLVIGVGRARPPWKLTRPRGPGIAHQMLIRLAPGGATEDRRISGYDLTCRSALGSSLKLILIRFRVQEHPRAVLRTTHFT